MLCTSLKSGAAPSSLLNFFQIFFHFITFFVYNKIVRHFYIFTQGRDASCLFPSVVKLVASSAPELKKLVYVYLERYAQDWGSFFVEVRQFSIQLFFLSKSASIMIVLGRLFFKWRTFELTFDRE